MLTYPKPTQNTELRGKKIRWLKMLKPEKFFENWTKDNIIEFFEELTTASEIEKSEAGLALLALNEELPAGFLFSKQTIRLYSELDIFLE